MEICEIDTPSLLVDLDRMQRNIKRMARFANECGVELGPARTLKLTGKIAGEFGSELDVYVETDTGRHRCSVQANNTASLAREVAKQNGWYLSVETPPARGL